MRTRIMDQSSTTLAASSMTGESSSGGGARFAAFVAMVLLLGVTLGQLYWASSRGGRQAKDFAYLADGAYQHLAIARELAGSPSETGSETPLIYSASPGWSLLLAGLLRMPALSEAASHNADSIALVPLVLNLAAAAILVLITGHLARREVCNGWWMFVLLMAMGFFMPLPIVVMVGMEHVLHACIVLLLVAAGIAAVQNGYSSVGWVLIAMILAAGSVALRYESLAVVAALLLWGWIHGHGVRGILVLLAGVGVVVAFGFYLASHGGAFASVPLMVYLKNNLGCDWRGWACQAYAHIWKSRVHLSMPWAMLLIAAALLAVIRASVHSADRRDRERSGWLFVFVFASMLHLLIGPTGDYRYEAYLVPMGTVAIGRTLAASATCNRDRLLQRGSWLAPGVCVLPILVVAMPCLLTFARAWETARDAFIRERLSASFVRTYFPTGPVLTDQAGVLRYETQARVLDPLGTEMNATLSCHDLKRQMAGAQVVLLNQPGHGVYASGLKLIGGWHQKDAGRDSRSSVQVFATSPENTDIIKMALRRASLAADAPVDVKYWFAELQSAPAPAVATQTAGWFDGTANRIARLPRPACEASCHRQTVVGANCE